MKRIKSSLIILTFNEIEGVRALFNRIPFEKVDESLVIDGGSTDGTVEFFKDKGLKIISQRIPGRGEAFRIALHEARGEHLVFFSPDGNEDPKDIPKLLKLLGRNYDLAIASRFMLGGRRDDSDHLIPYRGFGNRVFTLLANVCFKGNYTDTINGFRALKKEKLRKLNIDAQGFGIEYQISMRAMKLGYKIAETPTYEGDRIGGKSTAGTVHTGLYALYLLFRELLIGNRFIKTKKK